MTWIRIACGLLEDPKIQTIADACRVRLAEAAGCVVGVLARLPEHAPDGNLAGIADATLERWAAWEGKRGTFAQAFRAALCTGAVVTKWEQYNGRALRKADKEADRVRAWREQQKAARAAQKADANPNGTPPTSGSDTRSRTRTEPRSATPSRTEDRTRDVRGNVTERHVTAVRSEEEVPLDSSSECVGGSAARASEPPPLPPLPARAARGTHAPRLTPIGAIVGGLVA